MILTGNTISAHEAKDWHIISEIYPRDRLIEETLKIASKIA